jgi:hypothetical protein
MTTEKNNIKHHEGDPWFWKIFGGTMMSIISVLLMAYIGTVTSNIDRLIISLKQEIKDLSIVLDKQKERTVGLEKQTEQIKEKETVLENKNSQLEVSLDQLKQKVIANEALILSLKDQMRALDESNKDYLKQIQDIREKLILENAKKSN